MIISLAGDLGAGKSTVGRMLAERLGYRRYSTGDFFRAIAAERGITVLALNVESENDGGELDRMIDERQRDIGRNEDNFIIDARLGFHFIPHSFKIFLHVDPHVGATRIYGDTENETRKGVDIHTSIDETVRLNAERKVSESKRYLAYYSIDHHDLANYDLVIDTTAIIPEKVVDTILQYLSHL